MTKTNIHYYTEEEARAELKRLEASVEGGIEDFEQRARWYNLSPKEVAIWQKIEDFRWHLGID